MKKRLIITGLGNFIDAISTLVLFYTYCFTEANPVMRFMLESPLLFFIMKIGVMTAVLAVLWKNRESKYANIASWFGAILYATISAYYGILFMLIA